MARERLCPTIIMRARRALYCTGSVLASVACRHLRGKGFPWCGEGVCVRCYFAANDGFFGGLNTSSQCDLALINFVPLSHSHRCEMKA